MTDVTRRRFLKCAAISAASAASTKGAAGTGETGSVSPEALIRAAEAPVLRREKLTEPVIIDTVELLRGRRDFFVRVRSRNGAEGISVTNSRASYLYPIFNRLVAPYFPGKDARDLEKHLWEVYRYRSNYKLQGIALWCPVAWVECAVLDLLGRIAGCSMAELLGDRVRREVAFYIASGRRDTTAEQEVAHLQSLIDQTTAKAVKFRVGGRMSKNADSLPGRTEKLIPLARKVLGDAIALHADANSSYDPSNAIRVGRLLEEINAVYFEEPCRFDHFEETKQVADALTIAVAGGEQEYSQRRFRWAIENRGLDIVQPDLQYYGGMIRSLRVARMAAVAGMPTTVHISGGFGFVYMLHFASIVPDIGPYQEYKRGVERYGDWFDPPLRAREGKLTVPQGHGVGIKDIKEVLKGSKPVR